MFPRIREVHVRNYRSIAQAVVRLSDLTLLVGVNGSGKSNFVDAVAFVQEALSDSLTRAFQVRGGVDSVCRKGRGTGEKLGIRLIIDLGPDLVADYAFEIMPMRIRFAVVTERCLVRHRSGTTHGFAVRDGNFVEEISGIRPRLEHDRLALYAAAAAEEFRPLYDFLTNIRTYRIDPARIGALQEAEPGFSLSKDGGNAAFVLEMLQEHVPESFARISRLIASVADGITWVGAIASEPWRAVGFEEEDAFFEASSMSEGTLRLLGLLLAAYQPQTPSVLMIEEPEVAIHPAAAEVVMSVLLDASKRGQVLVTTHSPDIVDFEDLSDDSVRVVTKDRAGTRISPVSASSRQAIRERLYSPGELLRSDELNADAELSRNADLFGPPARTLGEAA